MGKNHTRTLLVEATAKAVIAYLDDCHTRRCWHEQGPLEDCISDALEDFMAKHKIELAPKRAGKR